MVKGNTVLRQQRLTSVTDLAKYNIFLGKIILKQILFKNCDI